MNEYPFGSEPSQLAARDQLAQAVEPDTRCSGRA